MFELPFLKQHGVVNEAARFILVGGTGFVINLGIVVALTEWVGLWYFFSYLVGAFINIAFNFYLNSVITFRGHGRTDTGKAFAATIALYLSVGIINAGLVYTLTSIFSVFYVVSVVIATACTLVLTFLGSKFLIFTKREPLGGANETELNLLKSADPEAPEA